tara:strand:- start:17348 stop:18379 length:1032 start_codon:yes stop_codon:yes gene_type:complete
MQYTQLGHSDLKVSKICLGTMTWGEQNSQAEAFEQLDKSLAYGVNFIDTAELYPLPPNANTYSKTETIIGHWLAERSSRDKIVLATKIAGSGLQYIRGGSRFNKRHLFDAVDQSLARLQTDYIDLYQLHWPERDTNFFGKLSYSHSETDLSTPIAETLEACHELVKAGKIRYLGISNETPWGMMTYLNLAEKHNWPRIVSIQNPYNLLNRSFEIGLSEIACRENCGLLAYSPLAFGVLTGKYHAGKMPESSRLQLFPSYSRYKNTLSDMLTQQYVDIAMEHGLTPTQLALAYVNSRNFLTSTIVGATTLAQLEENILSINVELDTEALKAIEGVHSTHPNPCP